MEQGNKYYNSNWNSNRPLASTGTVQKFIDEQVALKDIKKAPGGRIRPAQWEKMTRTLRKGKIVYKSGKVINPIKLNIDFANFKSLRTEG